MSGLNQLIAKVENYNPKADFALIKKAWEFAQIAHAGQKRLSGEDFIVHPLATAEILADLRLDTASLVVGLLHDTVEDTGVALVEIEKEFGAEIAGLVNALTKIRSLRFQGSSEDEFVENLHKMILAMAKDLRVIFVRLADRLHNIQTARHLPQKDQDRVARETLEIYAPLADRLGMGEIKGQLEDLAFPYVYPGEYRWLVAYAKPFFRRAQEFLAKTKKSLYKELAKEGLRPTISSRPKHLYSLWGKFQRPEIGLDINKVYDLVALRILVATVKDCYTALGIVHALWRPLPSQGLSDFVAQPKPNGYRSLHTKVFCAKRILEVQIRTYEMHEQAENGVAAHWYYAAAKKGGLADSCLEKGVVVPGERLNWVRQLAAWQKEVVDSQEFLQTLKLDAFAHRIFVFSPKGDVYDLPVGATPVDFAYAVHTELGDQADGAKVNNKLVPLNQPLKSGDMVEIIKKEGTGPTAKWLRFVVTHEAKRRINKHLRANQPRV